MSNIRQNLFFAFVYNVLGDSHRHRRSLSRIRPIAQPNHRQCGNEFELCVSDHQRAQAQKSETLKKVTRE